LAAAGPIWPLSALHASPARCAAGDSNRQAQRRLFNKFLGPFHHCLSTGRLYNEHLAFPPPLALAAWLCGFAHRFRRPASRSAASQVSGDPPADAGSSRPARYPL